MTNDAFPTTGTAPTVRPTAQSHDRSAGRRWLLAGVAAGPLFLLLSFAQVPFKEGFDLTRHPFSFLSLGDHGWIQQVNFVVTGNLLIVWHLDFAALCPGDRARRP